MPGACTYPVPRQGRVRVRVRVRVRARVRVRVGVRAVTREPPPQAQHMVSAEKSASS